MMNAALKKTLYQGLLMSAVIATAVPLPDLAFAQLSTAAGTSQSQVFAPMLQILSYACYIIGGVLVVGGVMKLKHHSENATTTPLSHGFSRLGAGAGLLALPYLMGLANSTATNTLGTRSTFQPFTF